MSNSIERDKKRRKLVLKYELKRLELKSMAQNQNLPPEVIFNANLKLAKLPRNSAKSRVKNRCVLTGRGRSVYKHFKLSRIMLREFGSKGLIPGLRKSSW